MKTISVLLATVAGLTLGGQAIAAGQNYASGSYNGLNWQAQSHIVGVESTATVAGGGNPIYLAQTPEYRGVVGLLIDYGSAGAFVCSGSLASDRQSIVTAGHCVSGGGAADPGIQSVTAYFYDGNASDPVVYNGGPGVTTIDVTDIFVNSQYTGEVIDQNDIAVLRLAELAPTFATAYGLYTNELTGREMNVAGYGTRSDGGGEVGGNLGTGRLRQGLNRYDFRLGDDDFNGLFENTDPNDPNCGPGDNFFCGTADLEYSYVSDFDNGNPENDASCIVASAFAGVSGPKFCDLGTGIREVAIDGGDSGGPQFIDGLLAGVNSYGLTFGSEFGDFDDALNSSFGEFSGYVPIFIHADWINSVLVDATPVVPEPASWAMMIAGFGLVGGAMRRRAAAKLSVA